MIAALSRLSCMFTPRMRGAASVDKRAGGCVIVGLYIGSAA